MIRFVVLAVAVASLASVPAFAQLALPGAANSPPAASDDGAKPPRPHRARPRHAPQASIALESVLDKPLRLNGRNGELQLGRGDDKTLKVLKFSLLGEVASRPSQTCRIDIVADKSILAEPKGEPDGLARYAADIPACPLTFDVVEGAVLVPAQANACVFTAADCQASPSGLWGPEPAELDKNPKSIEQARAAADRSIQDSLRELENRDADAAASLSREESDFSAERDDVCQAYASETKLGFCASRLAQSRAALLAKRVADSGPAKPRPRKPKRRHKESQ